MKILLLLLIFLIVSCSQDNAASGFGSSYADQENIVDDNSYAKLEKLRFAVNPKVVLSDTLTGYIGITKVLSAYIRIDSKFWGMVDTQTITYENPTQFTVGTQKYLTYSPNTTISINGLNELSDTAKVADYYDYLHGNIKPGEHLFSIEKMQVIDLNNDTLIIEINKAGMIAVAKNEREKFLGIFEGEF